MEQFVKCPRCRHEFVKRGFKDDNKEAKETIASARKKSFKSGIREVVEWMEQDCDCEHKLLALHKQCPYCMKAKLKEWGIEKK